MKKMRALSPSCRVVALAALMSSSFPPACLADFDATTMTTVLGQVDSILDMPTLHSTLIQDGFRSGFFLNNSGVEVRESLKDFFIIFLAYTHTHTNKTDN